MIIIRIIIYVFLQEWEFFTGLLVADVFKRQVRQPFHGHFCDLLRDYGVRRYTNVRRTQILRKCLPASDSFTQLKGGEEEISDKCPNKISVMYLQISARAFS